MSTCFHCGLPVPPGADFYLVVRGEDRPMCCAGCKAVAEAIVQAGLDDYYKHRTEHAPTARELVPEFLQHTAVYDNPNVQQRFVRAEDEHVREVSLILEGITCAACMWLNERHIQSLPGVLEVQVNYTTHRARVRWDDSRIRLSEILQAVSRIGYLAHPYDPARQQQILERQRRTHLRRLGVAGALGMQIMMFSIALYAGAWSGIEAEFRALFHWVNLVLTIPILFYSAEPFFQSAWRDLQQRRAGMDVPVSLGIGLAFAGSLWATLTHHGEVYYDSIAMFVFFLLSARYFELMARQRSARAAESLVKLVPETALRLRGEQSEIQERVLVADLAMGDLLLVRPGEAIAADGSIVEGRSGVDESLLTGESRPVSKTAGDAVIAGSVNVDSPLQIQVEKIGADTVLSHILRLLERAQSEKPRLTQIADRIAGWFVLGVLILAGMVAAYWWQHDPAHWLQITLSVLVVTCPCALSLATPAAITAATGALTRAGLLTTRGHALETLAQATHFVFDKTGTLTLGELRVQEVRTFGERDEAACLEYALALEAHSEHPIARALRTYAEARDNIPQRDVIPSAKEVVNTPGAGLSGKIGGAEWCLGTPAFIAERTGLNLASSDFDDLHAQGRTLVLLANKSKINAAFLLGDELRPGARELVEGLAKEGKHVLLLSGDHPRAVQRIADAVGIENYAGHLKPEDKVRRVRELQERGAIVAMTGDGVNDAPVLAQAQISIAMGAGTQVARTSADMVLLGDDLPLLLYARRQARRTLAIIRQNLAWALAYNLLALPAAAAGFVSPWMAALGMSFSSLLVVANALRLTR